MKNKTYRSTAVACVLFSLCLLFVGAAGADGAGTKYYVSDEDDFAGAVKKIRESKGGEFFIILKNDIVLTKSADNAKYRINVESTNKEINKLNVTILGNGHTIYLENAGAVIQIKNDKKLDSGNVVLNLGSPDGTDTLNIVGTKQNGEVVTGRSSAMVACQDATLNMFSGVTIKNTQRKGIGAGIHIYGNFNMYGGTITNCKTTRVGGGGIAFQSGIINIYDGNITKNAATGSWMGAGGGIFIMADSDCTINMYGGTISENNAEQRGGGIFATAYKSGSTASDVIVNIYGGSIENNTVGLNNVNTLTSSKNNILGAGIYASSAQIKIGSDKNPQQIKITGNINKKTQKADNLAIAYNNYSETKDGETYTIQEKITIGKLIKGTKIGITLGQPTTDIEFTKNYRMNNPDTEPSVYFTSDNSGYIIADYYSDESFEPSEVRLAKFYTVTFKVENGTWSNKISEDISVHVIQPQGEQTGGTLLIDDVPLNMIPLNGYGNGHWDSEPNTENNAITNDITYTYIFTKQETTLHTVTYDLNNGNAAEGADYAEVQIESGQKHIVKLAPTKEGHKFTGWSDGDNTYQPNDEIIVNSDITLIAQWEENKPDTPDVPAKKEYTVTYELNGGTVTDTASYSEKTVQEGTEITINQAPVRDGYTFTAWENETASFNPGDKIKIFTNTTLTARWTKNPETQKYTITYELNGGTAASGVDYSTETVDKGTEITAKAAPTKEGHKFTGWHDGTNTYQPNDEIVVNSDITLTAQWNKNPEPVIPSSPNSPTVIIIPSKPDEPAVEPEIPDTQDEPEKPNDKDDASACAYWWLLLLLLPFFLIIWLRGNLIYRILKRNAKKYDYEYNRKELKKMAKEIKRTIRDKEKYRGWRNDEALAMRLAENIDHILVIMNYPDEPKQPSVPEIMEAARGKINRHRL